MSAKRHYITTPIYYVNASPHLGHAYTTIVCDATRRFYSIMGYETYFLTGTDEHGENIARIAAEQNRSAQAVADENSAKFRALLPQLHARSDDFIRTTEPRHQRVVQRILADLHEKGDIYKAQYEGIYCVQCERFYTDKELDENRPGICPIHETQLKPIKEENYFFRMSKYQDWLREKIESEPSFINPPQFANEVLGILRDPLGDLCISRPKARLPWGIPFPFDEEYVVYVWFDALVNYLSALGFPDGELYAKYWTSANHVIAKDILRPHALYWPTMLKAMGAPVYQRLHVHGYWLSGGKKMSKTLGNVVHPIEMAEKYSCDALRYFVLREMVFGSDGDFTEAAMVKRYNADLANDFGNLVSRVVAMIQRYLGGRMPEFVRPMPDDRALLAEFDKVRDLLPGHIERMRLSDAIETILQAVRAVNRYLDAQAPWNLHKQQQGERLAAVLAASARAAAQAAGLLWPAMPAKCDEALACFGLDPASLSETDRWNVDAPKPGAAVAESASLFPRVDAKTIEKPAGKASAPAAPAKEKSKPVEEKGLIQYDDFAKLDLRVATILEAEKHPEADRLLRLRVDIGQETRQIVAGIAEHFDPASLIGRQIVVVANLAPRKLRGLESQGMLLAAHDSRGLRLIAPSADTEPGASVS